MNVSLVRIDERLIHGQVMTSWVKKTWVKRIVMIDDELAGDDFMKEVLRLSAPSGVKVEVRNVEDAYNTISTDDSTENTLLLFKDMDSAYHLFQMGYEMKELNIGNIGSSAVRKAVTKQVYMSEEEKEMAREMCAAGVRVYIQKLPQDTPVDILTRI